jgi:DNA repair protein RadA
LEDIPGIGPKTAEKLREVGFTDPMAIAVISPSELAAIAEIGEDTSCKNYSCCQRDFGYRFSDSRQNT